jgi:aspartyl-tRNA(Asn)/glutamyl-tRNA(Gln) amidotransferase subunit C
MPRLTALEVERIARLARLQLTDEEKARYAEQLSAVLDYAAELNDIDVADLPPTASVLESRNVMRPADEAAPGLSRAEALSNAPRADGASFEVQAALDHV